MHKTCVFQCLNPSLGLVILITKLILKYGFVQTRFLKWRVSVVQDNFLFSYFFSSVTEEVQHSSCVANKSST